jgi:hypothetical protein
MTTAFDNEPVVGRRLHPATKDPAAIQENLQVDIKVHLLQKLQGSIRKPARGI